MSQRLLAGALALAAVLVLPAVLMALTVTSVDPDTGTIGTRIEILGSGFGTAKPKVWLAPRNLTKPRKLALKVLEFDDGRILAELKKGAPDHFDLYVQPKKMDAVKVEDAFAVSPPRIDECDPDHGKPGDAIEIRGGFFGPKKPKVKIGGKKAKVTAYSNETITVLVGKKAADGEAAVEVRNKVATTVAQDRFTVGEDGGNGGVKKVTGTFNGIPYDSESAAALWFEDTKTLSVACSMWSTDPDYRVSMIFTYDIDTEGTPKSYGSKDQIGLPIVSFTVGDYTEGDKWGTSKDHDEWTLTILKNDGKTISGKFSGKMRALNDEQPETISFSGTFELTVDRRE